MVVVSVDQDEVLEFGQMQIDTKLHRVRVNGVDIQLKTMEYKLSIVFGEKQKSNHHER